MTKPAISPGEYTGPQLAGCLEAVEALLSPLLSRCVPLEIRVKLDTWRADMYAAREDREAARKAAP
jgi:hypothetical protein